MICTRCILSDKIPGISFDQAGVCNFCRDYERDEAPTGKDYPALEETMLRQLRANPRKHRYDCLALYSGGKDSSYMLDMLVNKYGLRVLAFTFDNWFIPRETYDNIERVLTKTDVDHVIYKPSWKLNHDIFGAGFNDTDRLASAKELAFMIGHACWPCFVQIAVQAIRLAVEKNIPSLVSGTTPGQVRQKKYDMVSKFGGSFDIFKSMIVPMLKLLKLTDKTEAMRALKLSLPQKLRALRVKSVPFYEFVPYNEKEVIRTVSEKFGWTMTKSTDSCSSNCQLNSLGIAIHVERYQLSPYVIPLARDVREGIVQRDEALRAVNGKLNLTMVKHIADRFGVKLAPQ